MKHLIATAAACAVLLAASDVDAQELRGRIQGVVKDNTGGVLPGVAVTVSGPALIQAQTTITASDGTYRFPALPPGLYALAFELPGFQTLIREGIQLTLNTTLTLDVELSLSDLQETVTITGESPTVDVTSTSVGTSFNNELLSGIPNARDIFSTMAQAPGLQMTGFDVGGSHANTQTGYITYGVEGQNTTRLEGINVTEGTDANGGYFDFGSFEEYQIGGSGNMGEQAGPGAMLNVTIKSGGDRFSGSGYLDFQNDDTIGDNVPDAFRTAGGTDDAGFVAPRIVDPATGAVGGLKRGNPITKQFDFNVSLGGPIVRERAWFFASYRNNQQFKTILGLPDEDQIKTTNITAKGTYQLNKSNQIIAFYNRRSKVQELRGLSLTTPPESAQFQNSTYVPSKLEWTSVLSSRAFLDLQFSHWKVPFPLYPTQTRSDSVDGVPVGRIELTTSQRSGANSSYQLRTIVKPQFSGSLAYYKENWGGTHDLKFGFETLRDRRHILRFQPGDIHYRDRNALASEVDIYNTPNESINDSTLLSIYARDSWILNGNLTVNLGVRYERYKLGWPEQSFTPNQTQFFDPVSTPATTVATLASLSPRVGFALDITGNRKTVWKAFFGRFYFNPSWEVSAQENPVGQAALRYRINDLNGNGLLDGANELGAFLQSVGGAGFVRVDRDLEHPYGDEFSSHLEHELAENVSVRGSYVYKTQRDVWAEVDVARAQAFTIPYDFTDPVTGEVLRLVDRPRTVPEDRVFTNPGRVGLPDHEGDYHTVEFAVNRRFRDRWMLLASFAQTWTNDWRGTSSSTGSTGVVRQGTEYDWDPNVRRLGKQRTRFWNYKASARYALPAGIGVAGSYKMQSGYNWARTISVSLPNSGSRTIFAEPVDSNRADNVHILDFRLDKEFNIGGDDGRLTAMVDVFNALNASPVTNFRIITGSRFKEIISLLDPRIVRVGVRYDF